jgi:hypothetical protein
MALSKRNGTGTGIVGEVLRRRNVCLLRHHLERVRRVGAWRAEIALDHRFEILEYGLVDSQLPLEITAHLAFHLIDLAQRKHALSNDAPGLVRVSVVANDFRGDHECGNK